MIAGISSIVIALVAAVAAAIGYWLYYRSGDEATFKLANLGYYVLFGSALFASVLLMAQILAHNFQLSYVYNYSSRDLPLKYLISTFWAGQEGTFLLWLLFSTIYGLILIRGRAKENPLALFFILLTQIYLIIILLKKSPFAYIWQVYNNVPFGFMPQDGAGLNPLLQNPWMVVHPPTLFLGYAATVVPFAMALSALVRKNFSQWVEEARPWVVYTVLILGAGIMLGGYWAYVTLGWGGYWAWDPVENSSLIPWLLSTALLHGIIIQLRQGGLIRTNLFLAALSFVAMLWGSFLTRSGVLTDFSVHSFGESGLNMYLIVFVLFFAGLFLLLYFVNINGHKGKRFAEGILSRETFIFVGLMTLLISAIFTFIGTSSPIFTGLVGKASNVSQNYYNTIHIPIAIFMLLTLGISPALTWKLSKISAQGLFFRGLFGGVVLTILGIVLGLRQPLSILLFLLSAFVLVTNMEVVIRFVKKAPFAIGGYLAHAGVALMMVGIITSTMYDRAEKITLPQGEYKPTTLGYELKFVGFKPMPDGKDRVQLLIKKGDVEFPAEAQFYFSKYTNSYMVSPFIRASFVRDLYVAPISYTPAPKGEGKHLTLKKGQTEEFETFSLRFDRFEVGQHGQSPAMTVTAVLTATVTSEGKKKEYELKPQYAIHGKEAHASEVTVPEVGAKIKIAGLNASAGEVHLDILLPKKPTEEEVPDMVGIEVSEKPFISILWIGTLVTLLGLAISLYNRTRKPSKQSE
jgi:cytochrome c-type biogenesis protein CcmF